ncbi:MAG: hypothetical protein MJ059_02825 [Lachnospiraceae bacterium]|nr:hypothetical protein [Lachnospiraceae bacterium]
MKKKYSFADQFYDRFCREYTLRYRDTGSFSGFKKGADSYRITSYRIDNVGYCCIIRVSGSFGKNTEAGIFLPLHKDAPLLMFDRVKKLSSDSLSINLFDTGLEKQGYRQFVTLSEGVEKIPDSDYEGGWYNGILLKGSVAKNIKGKEDEGTEMLESYLDTYIKCITYSENCSVSEKAVKISEISDGFLNKGGAAAEKMIKVLGADTAEKLFKKILFPEE